MRSTTSTPINLKSGRWVIPYSVFVMTNVCNDTTCLQLKDPVPPDHIATTIGEPGADEEIPNADKLNPVEDLSYYFSEPPVKRMIHLVVRLPPQREEQTKIVTPCGLSAHLVATERVLYLANNKPIAPSSAGKSNVFAQRQENPVNRIECNRPPSTAPATPPTLLHRVFGEFLDTCNSGNVTAEDHDFALNLSRAMSSFYETESGRARKVREIFEQYGLVFIRTKIGRTNYETDGDISLNGFRYVLVEIKNEICSTSRCRWIHG